MFNSDTCGNMVMFLLDTSTPTSVVENRFFKKILERIEPNCDLQGRKKVAG